MRTTTPATRKCSRQPLLSTRASDGGPLPPPGKTVAKHRPTPLATRAAHGPAAPTAQLASMLHCYILVSSLTNHESQITNHAVSNRHTPRLEIIKNPTKTHNSAVLIVTKTRFLSPGSGPGMQVSAAQNQTSHPRAANLPRRQPGHEPPITNHGPRRHYSIQMDAFSRTRNRVTCSKQRTVPILIRYKSKRFSIQSASPLFGAVSFGDGGT
jgi:hypothetical protein